MTEQPIRRCGNCAYAKDDRSAPLFLSLKCANPRSKYRGKLRSAGYFGCAFHIRGVPGTRKESRSLTWDS